MNWAHLPVAGGIYDQSPDLLDKWQVLFEAEGREEKRKQAIERQQQGHTQGRDHRRRG